MIKTIKRAIITIICFASFVNTALSQHQGTVYNIKIATGGFASFGGNNYTVIDIYLNNNSNDTLFYRGSDCHNLLFSVNNNPYFHLAYSTCKQRSYVKTALPPHRSQKLRSYLTMDKSPDKDVPIIIHMELYKWSDGDAKQNEELLLGDLSDSTVLHYNSNHQEFWSKDEFEVLEKKERSILPDKDLYLLTDNDRKLYTLTVDNAKISKPRDTLLTFRRDGKSKKAKVVTVPAFFHNNSEATLRFYTMSCSWYDYWHTNYTGIGLSEWPCEANAPQIITVEPHQIYRRDLTIIYDSTVTKGERYKVSMSLIKAPGIWDFDRWPGEYVRFNKIWSNEIVIK